MASRKKAKKPVAWKDTGEKQEQPEFQPEFLGALNRLVRGNEESLPEGLLVKVFSKLDQAAAVHCAGVPMKTLALQMHTSKDRSTAEALTRMQLVSSVGRLAGSASGKCACDPILSHVEKEHVEIEEHAKVKSLDMDDIRAHLPKELKGFAGVPALRAGRIEPTRCGLVKLGKSQGVFIEYGTCLDTCDKNMLMAFNTKDEPKLEPVEHSGNRYWMTRHENHTLAAWRGEKDGWLYVLITHCPFRNALALAELLRK